MFAKPLTFMLVFLLTIVNFIVLLIPISLVFFPFFMLFKALFIKIGPNLFFYIVSRISGLMIIYVLLDTAFGITMRRMRKGCIEFTRATSIYGYQDIVDSFEWLKQKFNISKVTLYIDPNFNVVNAYAIGSFSGSSVTVTMGLINQMHEKAENYDEYIDSIRAILGHEMSHLINKDFLPGLLTSASEVANRLVSRIVRWLFMFIATILRILPWIGWPISKFIITLYNVVNFIIMAFFNLIFMPLYNFLIKLFGRSFEYRCDRQSAYAYGGQKIAKALSFLGAGGYFSLFSTHPTTSSRIRKVQDVLPENGTIRPGIVNVLSDFISLALVVFICVYSASQSDVPDVYSHYIGEVYQPIKQSMEEYSSDAIQTYNKLKQMLQGIIK